MSFEKKIVLRALRFTTIVVTTENCQNKELLEQITARTKNCYNKRTVRTKELLKHRTVRTNVNRS